MNPAVAQRALFARRPRLVDLVPFVRLADGLPTAVERLEDRLWVQRDDRTDTTYGGNKVRKLEFLLAVAQRRGGPVLTAGADGSHHVLATAIHAARLGLDVEAVRYPQPSTDHVREIDAAFHALPGVRASNVPHRYLMPPALAAREVAVLRQRGTLVMPGATSPLGVLGHVSAGMELVDAFESSGWNEPDDVVVALGSGGSALGLAIGIGLAGWRGARVVAVRVADAVVTNHFVLAAHGTGTFSLLALGGFRPLHPRLSIETGYLGPGYGHPTEWGDEATARGAELGIAVEPTYTAKALAAALDAVERGRRVVFVQTAAG